MSYSSGVKFEWDRRKDALNLKKHGVPFSEAMTVFGDPLARIHDDPSHSAAEHREIIVGQSARGRLVFFTQRTDAVRIYSARLATRSEKNDFEESIS